MTVLIEDGGLPRKRTKMQAAEQMNLKIGKTRRRLDHALPEVEQEAAFAAERLCCCWLAPTVAVHY